MGRGFGRGAKSVAIVTHAQTSTAGKKTPKGLRSVRQKKRQRHQQRDEQSQLEQSLGIQEREKHSEKTLAQRIASVQIPHIVHKRQKGFKQLRKEIISAVKDVRRRHSEKQKKRARSRNTTS